MTNTSTDAALQHIDLPAGAAGWVEILRKIKAKRAELDTLEARAREEIQAALGDTEEGRLNGKAVVRWSHTAAPKQFNKKAFVKDHPDLAKKYTTYGQPGRRFTLLDPAEDGAA